MLEVAGADELRARIDTWRRAGERVAFVPTMGNLHEGHYALVDLARTRADHVVASIFVNPTQFGPGEDFARYPRTLADDRVGLARHGCALLFTPEIATLYPFDPEHSLSIHVAQVGDTLEGERRPGHFDGVATVVAKLLLLVNPDVAVFGEKDWQQLLLVRRLVRELALPLEIIGAPIVRAADGLALSSRNRYLDADERARAPRLHATLKWMRATWAAGSLREAVEQQAQERLGDAGFTVDYVVIRRAGDLALPAPGERGDLRALAAARLGSTRLIDNLALDQAEISLPAGGRPIET